MFHDFSCFSHRWGFAHDWPRPPWCPWVTAHTAEDPVIAQWHRGSAVPTAEPKKLREGRLLSICVNLEFKVWKSTKVTLLENISMIMSVIIVFIIIIIIIIITTTTTIIMGDVNTGLVSPKRLFCFWAAAIESSPSRHPIFISMDGCEQGMQTWFPARFNRNPRLPQHSNPGVWQVLVKFLQ